MPVDAPVVLFVCVHNAGRSQMAAGLLTRLTKGTVEVLTAAAGSWTAVWVPEDSKVPAGTGFAPLPSMVHAS